MIDPETVDPHLCRRQYRRYCQRLCHAPAQGGELRGLLSVPQREDPVVRRLARQGALQVLRLRQGRQCRHLPHGAREPDLSRGAEDGGQALRHRGPREGAFGGGGAAQRRPRVDVCAERLGRGVLRQLPPPRGGGYERRHVLLPPHARAYRRHDPQVRAGLLPREGRPHVAGALRRATSASSCSRRACRWSASATVRSTTASATA